MPKIAAATWPTQRNNQWPNSALAPDKYSAVATKTVVIEALVSLAARLPAPADPSG